MLVFLITIIILALIFDYINGFHDAANSIATIVSTKVLTPFQAVFWAAAFNFIAFFVFKEHKVAGTIANIISENVINFKVLIVSYHRGHKLESFNLVLRHSFQFITHT